MRLVMPMIVRNEDDILQSVLVHHFSQGVDHVLAIDDESSDRSPDILRSFERSGLLTLVPWPPGSWAADEARWRTLLSGTPRSCWTSDGSSTSLHV